MKKLFLVLIAGAAGLASCNNQEGNTTADERVGGNATDTIEAVPQVSLEQVWATDTVLEVPESVYYSEDEDLLYVSNIVGGHSDKDGEGYISKLSLEGEIVEQKWVTGLNAPKGIAMMDGTLYVTDIDELVAINVEGGEITNRYKVDGAKFLNDPVAADGKILFTDMEDNKIYALQDGNISVWKEEGLERPNGLAYNNGAVLVASDALQKISSEGETEELASGIGAGDGIGVVTDNSYLVSSWNGQVYYVVEGQNIEKTKVLDTEEQGMNTADIEYVKERNLLLVPTFSDNRVVAYKFNRGVE